MKSTMHEFQAAARVHETHPAQMTPQDAFSAFDVYHRLAVPAPDEQALREGKRYLARQLRAVEGLSCDLPEDLADLAGWIEARGQQVGCAFEQYLQERRSGAPRRFFGGKAHALNFLIRVAPTKLVDGAWLFSTLTQWRDPAVRPLILTYLEELGDGNPAMNHVTLYRSLLAAHGCEHTGRLSDEHYVQGALQLALGYHGSDLQPEVFGFNLGYEQLPLHLLITSYELNELGIDPYYFTLHVTIDNAASGHARKAAEAVTDAAALAPDRAEFVRRVRRGYLLNELGASTMSVIDSFDIQQELVRLLAQKAQFGKMMHSDYCRIGGKTVNEWLEQPENIPGFLTELEKAKWIQRAAEAGQSRFWRLIDAAGGEMFGVFSGYEKQVLKEWIENGSVQHMRHPSYRAMARGSSPLAAPPASAGRPKVVETFEQLIPELGPGRHHRPAGLAATRAFSRAYREQCIT